MGILDKITGKTEAEVKTEDTVGAKSEAKAEKKPTKKNKTEIKNSVLGVLISPIVTEKAALSEKYNKYTFAVELSATKNEIKKAIESRYGVKPVAINIVTNEGKYKRYGRSWGKRKDSKKAIATLPKGKSINVYETAK
jgi:large subunit ribosomal protein L23